MTTVPKCHGGCGRDVRQNQNGTWRKYCRSCNGVVQGRANAEQLREGAQRYCMEQMRVRHERMYDLLRSVEKRLITVDAALAAIVKSERAAYSRGHSYARMKYGKGRLSEVA